jgi:CHAT domain-containing protein
MPCASWVALPARPRFLPAIACAFLWLLGCAAVPLGAADSAIAEVNSLNDAGRWTELEKKARQYAAEAVAKLDWQQAGRMQYYACRALYQRAQHARALQAAVTGREYSLRVSDFAGAAYNSFGIGVVHLSLGSYELGIEAGRQMLEYRQKANLDLPHLSILQATLLEASGRREEARELLRSAHQAAERRGSLPPAIDALGRIGVTWLQEPEKSEPYLIESFRLAKLLHPQLLAVACHRLARLRLQQKRPAEAIRLFQEARRLPSRHILPYMISAELATAYLHLGNKGEALRWLRDAIATARLYHANVPFADELQMSRENSVQSMHETFALTAAELSAGQPDPALAIEAFEAVQENRAASLRTHAGADEAWRDRLPDEYWQILNSLRRLASRQTTDAATNAQLLQMRTRLVELETAAGLPNPLSAQPANLRRVQSHLLPGEVLVSFLLSEPRSLRWVIDRNAVRMTVVPGQSQITALGAQFRQQVERDDPAHRQTGAQLAAMLLSGIPESGLWTLIPDDTLFRIPFAAITLPVSGAYLTEKVTLRLAPTAAFLEQKRAANRALFVGFADPVTNRADPRAPRGIARSHGVDLPRLPNSAQEVQRCSRLWSDRILLAGPLPGIDELRAAMARRPRVLHFATHVYIPPHGASPVIALGYSQSGDWTILTDRDIVALGPAPELVTLSGCGSGRGPLAAGSGLLGLTRAWLMAGSEAVMATLWEIPDGGAVFMEEYYRTILGLGVPGASRKAAYALQKTQLASLSRTRPSVWAAYFLIGAI